MNRATTTSTGRCLWWLTAMTTASLSVTGCRASDGLPPAAADAPVMSHGQAVAHVVVRHHTMSAPAVPGSLPAEAAPLPTAAAGSVLVVSDGTDVVQVGGRAVRFPGPVTDATVSPNGQVIGYVDGSGNIATARLDGTDVRVLTAVDPTVRRAHPTFEDGGSEIVFTERGHDGVWRLKEVAADGHDGLTEGRPDPTVEETRADGGGDTAPSAIWSQPTLTRAARSVLVFQHRTQHGQVKVYVADRNQRGFGASALLTGSSPAVSPTGDQVAFIGTGGQIRLLPLDGSTRRTTQVTWGAHPVGHLAWSPDGSRLYFSTPTDVVSVSTAPARPGSNAVRVVSSRPGVASLGTTSLPAVDTFSGADPVREALGVSKVHFVDGTDLPEDEGSGTSVPWADHVTVVSADDPSAAAAAAVVAAGGPVLFVRHGVLDPRTRAEILRLLQRPRGFNRGTVDIVGSTSMVPDSIASDLRAARLRVRRLDPADPSAVAARATRGASQAYVVVSQDDLPAIASSAAATYPVLLTDGTRMPAATAAKLNRMWHEPGSPSTVYAVGADAQTAVRSAWVGKRTFRTVDLGGPSPYDDSLAAVQGLYDAPGRLSVTTQDRWQSLLVAEMAGPALVVDASGLTSQTQAWLGASQAVMRSVYVVGRPSLAAEVGQSLFGGRYRVTGHR